MISDYIHSVDRDHNFKTHHELKGCNITEAKFISVDSWDGERIIKQHAYAPTIRKTAWTREEYHGNRALCNSRVGVMNENEDFEDYEKLESEPIKDTCCKKCLKIYNNKVKPNH